MTERPAVDVSFTRIDDEYAYVLAWAGKEAKNLPKMVDSVSTALRRIKKRYDINTIAIMPLECLGDKL